MLRLIEASRSLLLCVHTAAAASRAVAAAGGLAVFLILPHRFYDRSDDENNDQQHDYRSYVLRKPSQHNDLSFRLG